MDNQKPRFRMEWVPRSKNMKLYARQLETAMNRLSDTGYGVQLIEERGGFLVHGIILPTEAEHPLARVLAAMRAPAGGDHGEANSPTCLAERSRELLLRFLRSIPIDDVAPFTAEANKQAPTHTKGFSTQEITVAADEYEKEAKEHEAGHQDPTCTLPDILRALAGVLREAARTNLQ